jgi:malonyl-CoA O-methyltransferase
MSAALHHVPQAAALARWQRRVLQELSTPWLHDEIAQRMADKLGVLRQSPQTLALWSGAWGGGLRALQQQFPRARALMLEPSAAAIKWSQQHQRRQIGLHLLQHWRSWRAWQAALKACLGSSPHYMTPLQAMQTTSKPEVDLLWANMALHFAADPQAQLQEWRRCLKVDGFLMFSTLGPDTLKELHGLYTDMAWGPAGIAFTDMHDWGDMLLQAGFKDPVMDMETLTLTYPHAQALLDELSSWGMNAHVQRFPGLRTRAWHLRLLHELEQRLRGPDGRLSVTVEVVYGHALRAPERLSIDAQTHVSLQDMRALLQQSKSPPLA